MNYSRLIFTIFSAIASILVFAIWSNNNNTYVYAQQLYSPSASPTPLSQLPQQTNNNTGSGNSSNSSIPIVLRPLPGGTCPSGYHLVSRAVCIKDIAQSAAPQTTSAIPTTNATKSFSIPSPAPSQPNATNPTNNEENFNTKILKSFNEELK